MLGAAGAVEMAICVKPFKRTWSRQRSTSIIPIPECDLDYVPHHAREMKVDAIVNNSFGFGGHNASIIAKRFLG
jgi:3-oxoacyl-[acyl-carrier-protein] synthase II